MPGRGPKPRKNVWCKTCSSFFNVAISSEITTCPSCKSQAAAKKRREAKKR